jgi:hypothetical protein
MCMYGYVGLDDIYIFSPGQNVQMSVEAKANLERQMLEERVPQLHKSLHVYTIL